MTVCLRLLVSTGVGVGSTGNHVEPSRLHSRCDAGLPPKSNVALAAWTSRRQSRLAAWTSTWTVWPNSTKPWSKSAGRGAGKSMDAGVMLRIRICCAEATEGTKTESPTATTAIRQRRSPSPPLLIALTADLELPLRREKARAAVIEDGDDEIATRREPLETDRGPHLASMLREQPERLHRHAPDDFALEGAEFDPPLGAQRPPPRVLDVEDD